MNVMTEGQATQTLQVHGASFVTTKQGVQWFRAADGSWIAKQVVGGDVVLKKLPANACSC